MFQSSKNPIQCYRASWCAIAHPLNGFPTKNDTTVMLLRASFLFVLPAEQWLTSWGWFNGLLPLPKHTHGAESEAEPFVISVLLFPAAGMMSECQRDATYPPEFDINGVSGIISVYEYEYADCNTSLFCQSVSRTWLPNDRFGEIRSLSIRLSECVNLTHGIITSVAC